MYRRKSTMHYIDTYDYNPFDFGDIFIVNGLKMRRLGAGSVHVTCRERVKNGQWMMNEC